MFFYLGQHCDLLNKQSDNLYTDLGWKTISINDSLVTYKGYCLDYNIDTYISRILNGDKPQGIYCVIVDGKLLHSEIRPFPLYQQGEILTNLKLDGFSEIYSNKYELPNTIKSLSQVESDIIEILSDSLTKMELNIWCTGGIDSVMLIALAEYAKLPYTVHVSKPKSFTNIKDFEGTVEEYESELLEFCRKKYWAYEFLSNFKNKVLTTGFYGDEYFCRSIWQIHLLANAFNKTGIEVVQQTDYVFEHINKFKYRYLSIIDKSVSIDNAKLKTLQTLGCSQIWHLDNTTTFCPLMDKRIAESVWSLDLSTLLETAPNAVIQRNIIRKTKPDVLLLVDSYKNTVDGRKNFFDNIEKVKLPYCKSLVVH